MHELMGCLLCHCQRQLPAGPACLRCQQQQPLLVGLLLLLLLLLLLPAVQVPATALLLVGSCLLPPAAVGVLQPRLQQQQQQLAAAGARVLAVALRPQLHPHVARVAQAPLLLVLLRLTHLLPWLARRRWTTPAARLLA
jgi:hypothetical protein